MAHYSDNIDTNAGHTIVVEDDSTQRRMLADYLKEQALSVKAVANRSELNRHIQAVDPPLIVLNLKHGQRSKIVQKEQNT